MTIDEAVWTSDATYALRTLKRITWISGTWPLEEGIFARIRFGIAFALGVLLLASRNREYIVGKASELSQAVDRLSLGILVSLLMEIQLSCGSADEKLDYLGVILSVMTGLTKIVFLTIHQEDVGRILSSALKDWSSIVDGSPEKDIMRRYARHANLVCRFQLGSGVIIVIAMVLDALPSADPSFSSNNETTSGELVKNVPLRTMCLFGNMTTSTYWTVFVLQSVQLLNAVIIETGNDCFFFGVAMYLCGQFEALTYLYDEFIESDEDHRNKKIVEFVDRHSYLLDLVRRLRNTLDNILAVLLMSDGLHICLLGIQTIFLMKDKEIIGLVKSTVAFFLVLAQLFVYSYIGDNLSSLSQNIHHVVYNCPWYEYPLNIISNLMFIMARSCIPLRITAGRFYTMNMDSFKEILKASFSYFSVLRIMFEE